MSLFRKDGYTVPVVLAIGLHLVIALVCIFVVDFKSNKKLEAKRPPIVNATVIDISKTIIGKREEDKKKAATQQAALEKQKAEQEKQKAEELQQRKALEAQKKKLAQAKAAKEKAIQQAEAAKKAAEEKQKAEAAAKKAAEQQALIAKQKADEKKRLEQQKQAEKLKAEQEAKQKAEEEKQRQIAAAREAEKERLAQEAAAKAAAEKAEQEKRAAEEAQAVQSISGVINDRIAQSWIRPPSARNGMQAKLRILFLPTGEVLDVQLVSGSGNPAFDQSAINAVRNMGKIDELSKLDPYVFDKNFRNIVIIFNPQDLRN